MPDTKTNPSNAFTDEKKRGIYGAWALCDFWTLLEAVSLLFTERPKSPAYSTADLQLPPRVDIIEAIARRCAGGSLAVYRPDGLPDSLCVRPREFLEWAEQKGMDVPGELRRAVDEADSSTGGNAPPEKRLRPAQRHREMCRGIAMLLWQGDPTITIEAMAQRTELRDIGCEGKVYAHDTIRGWINTSAPNRNPGRRPINQ